MDQILTEDVKLTCQRLANAGYEVYLVGGCVRDALMGMDPKDVDITTNAEPSEVQKLFPHHFDTGIKHGTVTVSPEDYPFSMFEVTTYRIDGKYEDGRHPEDVTFTKSLKEDLARRDFTVNAIAYNPIKNVYEDPFNGLNDIQKEIIRAVGNPKDRFMEDPLRVLRGMRFSIKLGFEIEENTKKAMHDPEVLQKLSDCISKERITEELRIMLTCGKPVHDCFLEFMDIIGVIMPEMKPCFHHNQNNAWHKRDVYEHTLYVIDGCNTRNFEIKMAALLHDIGKPASQVRGEDGYDHFYGHPKVSREISETVLEKDFKVSRKEKERILDLVEYHDMEIRPETKNIKKMLHKFGEEFIRQWYVLKGADLLDHSCPPGKEARMLDTKSRYEVFLPSLNKVLKENSAFQIKDLAINGTDLMTELGIKPGPEIGILLKKALDAVLNEEVLNQKEELLQMISEKRNEKEQEEERE